MAIVEDERDLSYTYSLIIRRLGYDAYVARNGQEIVAAVLEGKVTPDLVLMDYRMPGMNGLSAGEILREKKPDTRILVMSADDSIRDQVNVAGMAFLQKPFSISQLERSIAEMLGVREGRSGMG